MNTDCEKCNSPAPKPHFTKTGGMWDTDYLPPEFDAYRCEKCNYWNDLEERRKRHATEAQDSPLPARSQCPRCGGDGWIQDSMGDATCEACDGTGRADASPRGAGNGAGCATEGGH